MIFLGEVMFPTKVPLEMERYCCNSSLGLTTKVRVYKGAGQEGNLGVTSHASGNVGECEGMNPHTLK
jgi:hypothetical protein